MFKAEGCGLGSRILDLGLWRFERLGLRNSEAFRTPRQFRDGLKTDGLGLRA